MVSGSDCNHAKALVDTKQHPLREAGPSNATTPMFLCLQVSVLESLYCFWLECSEPVPRQRLLICHSNVKMGTQQPAHCFNCNPQVHGRWEDAYKTECTNKFGVLARLQDHQCNFAPPT